MEKKSLTKSLTNRQKQAIATRQKIFNTTLKLLKELNFDKITIRKICKEAEISVGTFYLYFKSKHHILSEIYKELDKVFMEVDINSRKDLNNLEKIKELIRIHISYVSNIEINTAKEIYASHIYLDSEFVFSEERFFLMILNEIILEGQKNKEIVDYMSSKEIVNKILKSIRGEIFDWLIHDGGYDIEKTALNELSLYLSLFKVNSKQS